MDSSADRKAPLGAFAFLEAFRFMVAKLEPEKWDKQIVNLVTDYVNDLDEEEEESF